MAGFRRNVRYSCVLWTKLTDRLHNLRTLQCGDPLAAGTSLGWKTLAHHIPAAEQLGTGRIGVEL